MGTAYTKTSPTNFVDGETIQASDFTTEFDAIDAAFETGGHQHDGTDGEGGAIEKLLSNTITFGTGADTDIAVTFNANTADGVLTWMEDEDYFKFSDDLLIDSTEKIQFRDTAIYIHSSADGQLDLVADTEIQLAATTVDLNGNLDVSGTIVSGGTLTATTSIGIGSAVLTEAELEMLDGITAGTAAASKAVVLSADKDIATVRNVTSNGTVQFGSLSDGAITVTAFVDEDDMSSNSNTLIPTQQSIKAYVDSQVGTVDTLAEILANGNTTGGTNIVVSSGDAITTNTISETTAASGVTIDSLLVKDGGITAAGTSTFASQTITDLGAVTTADINGGTIDGTVIGGASAAAGTFTTFTSTGIDDNASSTAVTIDSSQNVGIGTASPDFQLDVSGTTDPRIILQSTGTASTDDTIFMNRVGGTSATNQIWFGDSGSAETGKLQYDHSNNAMTFHTNGGTERMRIDSSGNVGIGVSTVDTALGTKLHVSGAIRTDTGAAAVNPAIVFDHDNFGDADANYITVDRTTEVMRFNVNASERIRITSTGNVGIGTTAPAKKLHVNGPALSPIGTLTDGATITPNFDANQNFSVTLGGNRTLANPTNIDAGQTGSIFVVQDGTGSRTLSFGSYWKFAGGTAPTLSTAAGSVDRIDYIVYTTTAIHAVATLNVS